MRIRYAPRALRDVDDILAYIHARNPHGAHNVSLAIERAIALCALTPAAGSKTDDAGLFRMPLGKYRYTVFYRFDLVSDVLDVVRVIHGARVKDLGSLPDDE